MITLDTNVLVRYLTKDDPAQTAEVIELLSNNECYVQHTVLLEVVWVLGSKAGHNWSRELIIENLNHLFSLPELLVQNPVSVAQAIKWYEAGMDFADALHLASAKSTFATFDRRLGKKAKKLATLQKVMLLGNEIH